MSRQGIRFQSNATIFIGAGFFLPFLHFRVGVQEASRGGPRGSRGGGLLKARVLGFRVFSSRGGSEDLCVNMGATLVAQWQGEVWGLSIPPMAPPIAPSAAPSLPHIFWVQTP